MDDEWARIKPQDNIEEMIDRWLTFEGDSVGWCFVCDSPIKSEADKDANVEHIRIVRSVSARLPASSPISSLQEHPPAAPRS